MPKASDEPVFFAVISLTDTGDVVAAVTGRKIRVLAGVVVINGAQTIKFQSGTATDLTGALPPGANGGVQIPFCPVGNFETVSGEKLRIVASGAVGIAGWLVYQKVKP